METEKEQFGIDYDELDGFSIRRIRLPRVVWGRNSEVALFKRGMLLQDGKLEAAGKLIKEGFSNESISKKIGLHRQTVSKLRLALKDGYSFIGKCGCGKVGTHPGVCWFREKNNVVNSPRALYRIGNKSHCLREWAKINGKNHETVRRRFMSYGWSLEDALSRPIRYKAKIKRSKEYYDEKRKEWYTQARKELKNSYTKTLLQKTTRLHFYQIPNALVKAKQAHLKVMRTLKENQT